MADLRPFLRLQTDAYLNTLKARVGDSVVTGTKPNRMTFARFAR
jgi:hypothetical protein